MVGFNLMKNVTGMQLLLLLLLFAQRGFTSTEIPKCHELMETLVLMNDPGICTPAPNKQGMATLGNLQNSVKLDFSQANETTLNNFLAKFHKVDGTIVMDGNDKVETLKFGNITTFQGQNVITGGIFILIRNNPMLKKIEWDSSTTLLSLHATAGSNVHILIYNNPLLETNSLALLRTAVDKVKDDVASSIQNTGANECQFESPYPTVVGYTPPTAEFLKNCAKINGDFIVKDVNLTGRGPFKLSKDACLSLVNVDLKNVKFDIQSGYGDEDCKDGTKSNLTNNPNLCGDDVKALKLYYQWMSVPISVDKKTCTMPCATGNEDYVFCESTPAFSTTAAPIVTNSPSGSAGPPVANLHGNSSTVAPPMSPTVKAAIGGSIGFVGLIIVIIIVVVVLRRKGMLKKPKTQKRRKRSPKELTSSGKSLEKRNAKKKKGLSQSGSKTSSSTTDTTRSKEQMRTKSRRETRPEPVPDLFTGRTDFEETIFKTVEEKEEKEGKTDIELEPEEVISKPFKFTPEKNFTELIKGFLSAGVKPLLEQYVNVDYCGGTDEKKRKPSAIIDENDPAKGLYDDYPILKDKYDIVLTEEHKAILDGMDKSQIRYSDQACFEHTMVKLNGINYHANRVTDDDGIEHILTQAPTKQMIENFWQMVYQEGSRCIVMLCNFEENGNPKCAKYVDLEKGKVTKPTENSNYEIKCVNTWKVGPTIRQSTLELRYKGKLLRTVNHLYFLDWPDKGVPSQEEGMKLFFMWELSMNLSGGKPIIVHCSAGVGRTGVFVLLSQMMNKLKNKGMPDMLEMFKKLRSQRARAVQVVQQYIYIAALFVKKAFNDGYKDDKEKADDFLEKNEKICVKMKESQQSLEDKLRQQAKAAGKKTPTRTATPVSTTTTPATLTTSTGGTTTPAVKKISPSKMNKGKNK